MKATGASEEMALEVVSTPGTRANLLMNCGGRFLKSAEAFAEGLEADDLSAEMHEEPAVDVGQGDTISEIIDKGGYF